jgi:hypothetical protein
LEHTDVSAGLPADLSAEAQCAKAEAQSAKADDNALQRLIGMIRSPYATLTREAVRPRSFDLAALILVICAACSVGFLMTRVGRLAALDQQVRYLESVGIIVSDEVYAELRRWLPYRPALSGAAIVIGWPIAWLATAAILRAVGNLVGRGTASFSQVHSIVVHASSVFALQAIIAMPVNYVRESLGGATSFRVLMPGLSDSTFPARLLSAVDMFVVWWIVLMAMGLGILYQTRTVSVAGWLFGAYVAGAAALALTQVLLGGI